MNTPKTSFIQSGPRTVVITGGFGALGQALATVLLAGGACVALLDKAAVPTGLADGVLALGGVDLGDAAQAQQAMERVVERFGAMDGLVNVAGGFHWERVESGSIATWDRLYDLNVRTALQASQAALAHLLAQGRGRIVNVGSLSAGQAGLGMGAYAASKAGVARLTEAMAEEFKDRGMTVNAVLPGTIDTPANRASIPQADVSRWIDPEALARVIAFLLSDDAAAINGALIPVKGKS